MRNPYHVPAARFKSYQKRLQDFCLMDDDFMTRILEDPLCVQLILRIVMDRDDLTILRVQTQYTVKNLQGRSARLDIYAADTNGKEYNIEIQRDDKGAIAKRARYHSSLIDANTACPGEEYECLPGTYVIFITEHDILRKGLPIYHIDRIITETGSPFDDDSHIIYINGQYRKRDALGLLMEDFFCKVPADMHYPILADRVRYFKENEEGVAVMCKAMEEIREEGRTLGRKEGRALGRRESKRETARSMFRHGLSRAIIKDCTGLSDKELEALQQDA